MTTAVAVPPARVLPMRSRLAFGLGSIAYGVKDNGFATFLLLFYNQVVGLSAASVGIAIMMAMMVEAFVDPAVGFLSDHTRSKWGRRHPWMYASAIPVAIGWLLLWNPPVGWSETALLFYLFGSALLVRIALSAFEIPASALAPELSSDYDERTKLFSYRYLFGWVGGLGMLSLAYGVFLVPDASHAVGLQNGPGYSSMATMAAIVMAVAILVSSVGLHGEIKYLPKLAESTETLADHFRAFRQTISNKAFGILMLAGVCAYTGQGISFALSNYMYQYVWEFSGGGLSVVVAGAADWSDCGVHSGTAPDPGGRQSPDGDDPVDHERGAARLALYPASDRAVSVTASTRDAALVAVDLYRQHRLRGQRVHHWRINAFRCC